jgi:hypothetical protein
LLPYLVPQQQLSGHPTDEIFSFETASTDSSEKFIAITMTLSLADLYEDATAFPSLNVAYNAIDEAFGSSANNLPTPAEDLLRLAASTATNTPIVLALLSSQNPGCISFVSSPALYAPTLGDPSPLDGEVFALFGSQVSGVIPLHIPATAMGAGVVRVLNDPAAVLASIRHATHRLFAAPVEAAEPNNSVVLDMRRALVMPTDMARLAVSKGSVTPEEFYAEFLAPHVGTPREAEFLPICNWWRAVSTLSLGATRTVPPVHSLLVTGRGFSANQVSKLQQWTNKRVTDLLARSLAPVAPGVAPPTDPLTGTAFTGALTMLSNQLQAHQDAQEARAARAAAPRTYSDRFGSAATGGMLRLVGVDSEDDLSDLLKALGSNKHAREDLEALVSAIAVRASEANCVASQHTRPRASVPLINMLRNRDFAPTNDDLGAGLTPFAVVCDCHSAEAKKTSAKFDLLQKVEAGTNAVSYADAIQFSMNNAKLPVNERFAGHQIEGHSLLVDLVFGPAHALATAYRHSVQDLILLLSTGLEIHYPDTPNKRREIALRVMYWIQQEVYYYIRKRAAGQDPPLPDFDRLVKDLEKKNFHALPELPQVWLVKENAEPSQDPATPNTEDPTTKGSPEKGASQPKAASAKETNLYADSKIMQRWKNSGARTIGDLLAKGDASMPKIGNKDVCLSFHFRGYCSSACKRSHKKASATTLAEVHALLDACGVAAA